jgi:hypothetical protein
MTLEYFDRHVATQARVLCAIHLAHAACAERRNDFVGTKFGAGSEGHVGTTGL